MKSLTVHAVTTHIQTINLSVTMKLVFLLPILTLPIQQIRCSMQYFKFADQSKPKLAEAQNYAILLKENTSVESNKAPLEEFTICSSINIGYYRGHQAFYTLRKNKEDALWFSLYINSQDLESESYTTIFAYFGDSKLSKSKQLKLKPHDWSHACTSLDKSLRRVFVVINGVLVHDLVVKDDDFWENFPPVFEGNLLLGVAQWQYSLSNTDKKQSEASVTNLKVFMNALKTPSLIELTSKELCSEGDYLSWSNANWTFWGNVTKCANVDFCTKATFPHLYFFPAHFHLWENCISLCPRFQEGGRIPFVLPLFYLCFRRVGGYPLLPMPPTPLD